MGGGYGSGEESTQSNDSNVVQPEPQWPHKVGTVQWRIQDFPLGGAEPLGGGCRPLMWVLFGENMQKLKNWILLGGCLLIVPPGSTNAVDSHVKLMFIHDY